MLGAVGALLFGIVLMAKGGGKENELRQNRMMSYRIWFQAGAILLIVLAFSVFKK